MTDEARVVRVTVTLDPEDVELLDRLGALEGQNRSSELRSMLAQIRPVLRATVAAYEAAEAQRGNLDRALAAATVSDLEAIAPEVDRIQNAVLGAVARLEGLSAAEEDPRRSNHGGHTPTPPPDPTPS